MYFHLGVIRGSMQFLLVSRKSVQEHLQLTEDQVEKIEAIAATQAQQFKDVLNSRTVDLSATRREYREQLDAAQRAVDSILDARQFTRLDQLAMQSRKTSALHDPVVADVLQLTAPQKLRIRTIQDEASRCNPRHARCCDRQVFEVLTPRQLAEWEKLTGEPFDLPKCAGRDEMVATAARRYHATVSLCLTHLQAGPYPWGCARTVAPV